MPGVLTNWGELPAGRDFDPTDGNLWITDFVADGHSGLGLVTEATMAEARAAGATGRIVKFMADGTYVKEWGQIGSADEDRIIGYILYQGTAGEGVAVDADGNTYAAQGPNSLGWAGGAFTRYLAE